MKRAELLRLLALAPVGAFLTSCRESSIADPADRRVQLTALQDRALDLCERIEKEGGADGAVRAEVARLANDLAAYTRRWGSEDFALVTGLTPADVPEPVKVEAALAPLLGQPWGPGCKCQGYWTGCIMYLPTGEDTCEQGSCLFVCIDWFCRLLPRV